MKTLIRIVCLTVCLGSSAQGETVVDFETLGGTLAADSAYVGADTAGRFVEHGAVFNNSYNTQFNSWEGNAYSNRKSFFSGGFAEFSNNNDTAVLPTVGVGGSNTWGIANSFAPNTATIEAPQGMFFKSLFATNTKTVNHIIRNGNGFSDPFGGASGNDPDLFTVRFNNLSAGATPGFVELVLADFRFDNSSQDYVIDEWTSVDLTPLNEATKIGIEFTSTDVGAFGINTPTYVGLDNIVFEKVTAVPEPATTGVLFVGAVGVFITRRRRKKRIPF